MGTLQTQYTQNTLGDLVCLIKHVGRISLWESPLLPPAKRLARRRANERRKKLIMELGANLSRSLQERFRGQSD